MGADARLRWFGRTASLRSSIVLLCGLFIVLLTAMLVYWALRTRQFYVGHAMGGVEGLAGAYTAYTERAVHEVDFSLLLVQEGAQRLGRLGAPLMQSVGPALELQRQHTPYVSNLVIIDAAGLVVSATHAASASIGRSVADREYFTVHRSGPDAGLFIGPVFSPRYVDPGEMRFSLSRRLNGPHGEFLGVVSAMVDAKRLSQDHARQISDPSVSVTLMRIDGMVLARTPYLVGQIGTVLPSFARYHGDPPRRSSFVIESQVDHVHRLIAQRRFGDLPMLIAVTQREDVALAQWIASLPFALGVWVLAVLSTAGLGALVLHQQRGREHAQQELRRGLEVFNAAQRMAQVGTIDRDLASGEQHWSDEVFRLLEIDPARADPTLELRHERVHAEDRERVAHTCGQSKALGLPYQVAYRLQMPDGRVKWISESCSYIRGDGAARPLREVIALQDVTNARQAEEELVNLRAALDTRTGPDGRDPFAR